MHISPMNQMLSEDPLQAATQINAAMENMIRMAPEQYLWGYDRYKEPVG
jgi:KDO2-lipid IV(A) lauroyltransferase